MTFHIVAERPQDAALLDSLLDRTFGTDRHKKTVYRLREGIAPVTRLCFVTVGAQGEMIGSLRFWSIRIGDTAGLLFGPLAVEPALQGLGIGRGLVRHGLSEARRLGERICVAVGEPAYYEPFGFVNAGAAGLRLPGPVAAPRFQVLELVPGALTGVSGMIGRADEAAAAPARAGAKPIRAKAGR